MGAGARAPPAVTPRPPAGQPSALSSERGTSPPCPGASEDVAGRKLCAWTVGGQGHTVTFSRRFCFQDTGFAGFQSRKWKEELRGGCIRGKRQQRSKTGWRGRAQRRVPGGRRPRPSRRPPCPHPGPTAGHSGPRRRLRLPHRPRLLERPVGVTSPGGTSPTRRHHRAARARSPRWRCCPRREGWVLPGLNGRAGRHRVEASSSPRAWSSSAPGGRRARGSEGPAGLPGDATGTGCGGGCPRPPWRRTQAGAP